MAKNHSLLLQPNNPAEAGKFDPLAITRQTTQKDTNLSLPDTTAVRSTIEALMTSACKASPIACE